MDGLYNYKVQKPIFRQYLQEMSDEQLSSMVRDGVFLCETSLGHPWKTNLFKTNLSKRNSVAEGSRTFRSRRKVYSEIFEALVGLGVLLF